MEGRARLTTRTPVGTSRTDNLWGAAWMSAGMLGYVVNDALIKWAAEDLPLFQAIFLRGCAIVVLLIILVRSTGSAVPLARYFSKPLVVRMSMEAAGTVAYLLALTKVPLASLTAILQLVPIAVTFVAARLLRESVNVVRIAAVLAGFVGVLFIIKPGSDDFSPWFIGGLVTVTLIVVRELATRHIPSDVPGVTVALGTGTVVTALALAISAFDGWERPAGVRLGALAVAAVFLSLGYVGSINSIRRGDLSFTAPFRYSILVFAIVMQILLFRDVPDGWTFLGAGIIAFAGLLAVSAERVPFPTRARPN